MTTSERKMNPQELRRYEEWERKFRLSEKFIRESGRMPLVKETYDGICLYRWLILEKSKYINGKMTQETVERFKKIGVDIAHFSARPKTDLKLPLGGWAIDFKKKTISIERKVFCDYENGEENSLWKHV